MSKVKEKVMEEVKKEKGEVEKEKEGRGGKKKMEKLEEEVYVKEKAIGRQEEKREKQIDKLSTTLFSRVLLRSKEELTAAPENGPLICCKR